MVTSHGVIVIISGSPVSRGQVCVCVRGGDWLRADLCATTYEVLGEARQSTAGTAGTGPRRHRPERRERGGGRAVGGS